MAMFTKTTVGTACWVLLIVQSATAQVVPNPAQVFTCDFMQPANGTPIGRLPTSSGTQFMCNMTHTNLWITKGNHTSTASTGPVYGVGGHTDQYGYMEANGRGSPGLVSYLVTPRLGLGSSGGKLTYYYHMYGYQIGSLLVEQCTGFQTGCTTLVAAVVGQQQTSQQENWTYVTASIAAGNQYVRWNAVKGTGQYGDIAVDRIQIVDGATFAPTSPAPTMQVCPGQPANPFFDVAASWPHMDCIKPVQDSQASCFTEQNGDCFTDGPGNHGNQERCDFRANRDGWLYTDYHFVLETGCVCDWMTVGNNSYRHVEASTMQGLQVRAGDIISFVSDWGLNTDGYTICAQTAPTARLPYMCDFMTPTAAGAGQFMCNMNATGLWRTTGNHTSSANTGPVYGVNGHTDLYAYIETSQSSAFNGFASYLTTPRLPIGGLGGYLVFNWHMYGATIGTLTVNMCDVNMACTQSWTRSGQFQTSQQQAWNRTTLPIASTVRYIQFVATRTTSFTGDIAVDAIQIVNGSTMPPTTQPPVMAVCQGQPRLPFFEVDRAWPHQDCLKPVSDDQSTCFTTQNGQCFTDGPGNHGNQERCDFRVLTNGTLNIPNSWALEVCPQPCDYFVVGNSPTRHVASSTMQGLTVREGDIIRFTSDWGAVTGGFTVCGVPDSMPPTTAPTVSPTLNPSAAPTAVPTTSPTSIPSLSPTSLPTSVPTLDPTASPSRQPSARPTRFPTWPPPTFPAPSLPPTGAPVTSDASSSGTDGAGMTLYIVVIVAVLIIVVVLALVYKNKSSGSPPVNSSASFANPVYDESQKDMAGQGDYMDVGE